MAFSYALTGDLHLAQDPTQEALARAWDRWSRISSYDDPEGWAEARYKKSGHRQMATKQERAALGLSTY